MTRPIDLWYWPTPNGWKVSIALEEMELPYEMKPVNIGAGEQFDPAFQAISPNGRMPAIVDPDGPDGQPLSIFESGAIMMYPLRSASEPIKASMFLGSVFASVSAITTGTLRSINCVASNRFRFRLLASTTATTRSGRKLSSSPITTR